MDKNHGLTRNSYGIRGYISVRAIFAIKELSSLSLDTAMKLFHTTIAPVVTYGVEMIWDKLSISDMERIEKVKARFLKRALGAGKFAPNRYMYLLARETFFIGDLRVKMALPSNESYNEVIARRTTKQRGVDSNFFCTDAMIYRDWTKPNQSQRYAIVGLAIHGYHHKMCQNSRFHQPDEKCVCKFCVKKCELYHFSECRKTSSKTKYKQCMCQTLMLLRAHLSLINKHLREKHFV